MPSESLLQPNQKSEIHGRTCIKCDAFLIVGDNWTEAKVKACHYSCLSCSAKYRTDLRNSKSDAAILFDLARDRAKRLGREFTISIEDVESVDTDICPILKIPIKRYFHISGRGSTGFQRPDSKSLDRIDSTKGYIPGNIRIISWRANSLLKDITQKELQKIAEYYLSTTNQWQ